MKSPDPFADRIQHGDLLLGAVARLPGDDVLTLADQAGLDFIVIDLVDGPVDEVALRRLVRSAHWAGLGVIALADVSIDAARLRSAGADGILVHRNGPARLVHGDEAISLAIVGEAAEAERRIAGGAQLVAIDIGVAMTMLLTAFVERAMRPIGFVPLVLLPGMLGDARVFDDVVAALPSEVTSLPIRIDLDDSIAEIAESVLAVAPPRFALAGHSLGAVVALEVWRRAPSRVTRLALLNASARSPSDAQLAAWAHLRDRTESGEFAELVAEQAEVNVGSPRLGELVQRWVEFAEKVGPAGFLRQLRAQASRPDSRPSLAGITVPTLVVTGGEDSVCPRELQLELAAGIPGARHVTIEGAGHMSPLDHPSEVAACLATWLNET